MANEAGFADHLLSTTPDRKFAANRNRALGGRSWVYFAQHGGGGPVKIGRTRQLNSRLTALQTFCPEEVLYLGRIAESVLSEERIHIIFNAHRRRGEWFNPTPEMLALASAGKRVFAAGYPDEEYECLAAEWRLIRSYASCAAQSQAHSVRETFA